MVEVEASSLFENENVNWRFCKEHATFVHKDACEFILHIGTDEDYSDQKIKQMQEYGCTVEFLRCYEDAVAMGAMRILFYV